MSALRAVVVTNFNDAAIDKYFRGRLGGLGIQVAKVWKLSDVTKMAQGNLPIPAVEADGVVYSIGEIKNGRVVELRNWLESSGLFCVGFAHKNRDTTDFMRLIELERDKRAPKPVRNALRKLPEPEPVEAKTEVVQEAAVETPVPGYRWVDGRSVQGRRLKAEREAAERAAEAAAVEVVAPAFDGERREIDGWALVKLEGDTVPRILDTDLAKQLEYADPTDIRKLIKAHERELLKFGDLSPRSVSAPGLFRGKTQVMQEVTTYYPNRKQAVYLAIHSTTDKAKAMAVVVVDVFDAWTQGTLPAKPGTLDEDVARFLAQRTEARLAEQEAASKARDEELARKQAELETKQEEDRKAAQDAADAAMKHADAVVATIPGMVKKAVDERPPLRTPLQQPLMQPGVPMSFAHRSELRRVVGNICVGYATLYAPSGTDECAAEELWFRETTWRLAGVEIGHVLTRAADEAYENWLRVIPVAAENARQLRERMRTTNKPLPPSYLARINARVKGK